MNDSNLKRVQDFIDRFDEDLEVFEHNKDTSTVKKAANALGVEEGQIAKSLLFNSKKGYFMVVCTGDVKIDENKLQDYIGCAPKLAKPSQVKEITGYPVGGVCPFDLKGNVKILLDKSLKRFDVVYIAAGTPASSLPINFIQLENITKGIEVDVTKPPK